MKAPLTASFNIKGPDNEREERKREVGGGDRRELSSVCWWANSISGNTIEAEADFKKANCNCELYCACLVSSSPEGRRPGPEERTTLWWGPATEGDRKWNCLKCVWYTLKIGQALMAASWIHSESHSIGFDQMEWVNKWGSSGSTQTMMLLPQWWASDPHPRDFCRQSLYYQP